MLRTNEMNFKLSSSVHRCSLASNATYSNEQDLERRVSNFLRHFPNTFLRISCNLLRPRAPLTEQSTPGQRKSKSRSRCVKNVSVSEQSPLCVCVCVRCFAITLPWIVSRRRIQDRGKPAVKYACQWPSERPKRSATRAPTRARPRFRRRVPNVRVQTGMENSKRGDDCARTTFVGIVRRRIPIDTAAVDFSGL